MRKGIHASGWLFVLLAITSLAAGAQEPTLTIRQAVDEALGKNPDLAATRADVNAARAGVSLARTGLWPRLNFTEDIGRGNDPVYVFGTRLRQQRFAQSDFALSSLNRPSPINNFATRFDGSWTLFNSFGTQQQIKGARLSAESVASMSAQAKQGIVMRVVQAYQSVLFAERRVVVSQREEVTAEMLSSDSNTKVSAGLAVDSDKLAAQVNLSERQQELIAAQGDLDVSWVQLEAAIGTEADTRPTLKPIEPKTFPDGSLAQEITGALKTRPDLQASHKMAAAQTAGVTAAKSAFGPQVSAYGDWEMDRQSSAGDGGNNWVAGVQLRLDLFPLAKRQQLAEQEAARQKAVAQERSAEQQIRLAVSTAHSQHQTAERIVKTAQASTEQAAESLRIVQNRYKAGLATITELLRAEDAQRLSQNDYWRAVYGNTFAYANLLYATGTLTPDSAEDLQ
jgi:outer membrane protein